jgi:hypothetical protein
VATAKQGKLQALSNTGLARAKGKLFAGKISDDDLQFACIVNSCHIYSDNVHVRKMWEQGDSLEIHVNVLKRLLVRQFTNLI